MLRWSLNLFRVRGIQLAVHWSFFLLLAYGAIEGWQTDAKDPTTGGWAGLLWRVGLLVCFFSCVGLHEFGHSFTAMRFGVGVRRILLMPIGGMAEFDSIPRQPSREFLITIAGPLVNFVIAALLWLVFRHALDAEPGRTSGWFVTMLFYANIVMGCFNFVPAFPMDGGRILRATLASRMPYLKATRVAATVGKIVCVVAISAAVLARPLGWADDSYEPYLPVVLFSFIFIAGEVEYRAAERREREDAHWRAVLARIYGQQGPIDEPPVLSP